jgi:RNA polymerase sigma-70 factor (ECF subfamily)
MVESILAASAFHEAPTPDSRLGEARSHRRAETLRSRFDRLCAPLRDELFRFVVWLTRDPGVAEDVVQETLVRAWRRLDSLEDEGAVKPWLLKIARREAARHFGRKRHHTASIHELVETNDPALATQDPPDDGDVRAAILALESAYREPLVLQVLLGLTTAEIAEVTGITQATVLTRLFRARNKLRARFLDAPVQPPVDATAR